MGKSTRTKKKKKQENHPTVHSSLFVLVPMVSGQAKGTFGKNFYFNGKLTQRREREGGGSRERILLQFDFLVKAIGIWRVGGKCVE